MAANRSLVEQEEKRMDRRIGCKARINWSYFNENRFFDAKVFNYSRNGVYLETQDRIRPNTTILIRLEALHAENKRISDSECIRTVSLGEVKWCRELSKEDSGLYGAGVRYCRLK